MIGTLSVTGYKTRALEFAVAPSVQLCRILHDCERAHPEARNWVTDLIPEPFRASPSQTIPIKNYPALLSLHYTLNPTYTHERADDILGPGLCFCNQNWGVENDAIITGGAVLEVLGVEAGRVYVNSILISDPIPTAEYVLAHHLSFLAVSVHKDLRVGYMTRPDGGPDGHRSKVRMFVVRKTVEPLWFPAEDVQLLPPGQEPEETWTG